MFELVRSVKDLRPGHLRNGDTNRIYHLSFPAPTLSKYSSNRRANPKGPVLSSSSNFLQNRQVSLKISVKNIIFCHRKFVYFHHREVSRKIVKHLITKVPLPLIPLILFCRDRQGRHFRRGPPNWLDQSIREFLFGVV